jgi:hypothetical protein
VATTDDLTKANSKEPKDVAAAAMEAASTPEQKREVLKAVADAATEPKDVAAAAIEAASTPEQEKEVVRAVAEGATEPKDVAAAAIEAASTPEQEKEVVRAVAEGATEPKDVATAAVEAASTPEKKKETAGAAVDALSQTQRRELIESRFPTVSADRRAVYVTGFLVAGAVALGLAAIAWGAQGAEGSVAASLVVLATGFASAMLGGLLGAYIQR